MMTGVPDDKVELAAKFTQKPDRTPLIVYAVPYSHCAFKDPSILISFWIMPNLELKCIPVPEVVG